ncbi:MAG: hypothetical protein Q4Q21_06005 [Lachnospiraceae bacterium]|nr:hypothetical protein [Lachnospiraceae bacterium]
MPTHASLLPDPVELRAQDDLRDAGAGAGGQRVLDGVGDVLCFEVRVHRGIPGL